jgi:retinoid hydroxylase
MNRGLKPSDQMPGSFGLPIIGEGLQMLYGRGWQLDRNYQRYGPIFKTSFLGRKYAVLVGPEANKIILQDQVDRVSSYLGLQFFEPMFGQPLMLQDGETHRASRKLMAPAFHGKAIASYFETMQQVIDAEVSGWDVHQLIPIAIALKKLALTIGIRLLLGIELDREVEQVEHWYNTLVRGLASISRMDLPFTSHGRGKQARRQLNAFMQGIIQQHHQQGNLQESKDVLGMFLTAVDDTGNPLPTNQIIDELVSLLSGAHLTIAHALTWSIVELAAHPELRENLRAELQQVTDGESLNLGHLRELNQMTYFMKEIERVYSPAGSVLVRGVVKEIEYAGYLIPPGWGIMVGQALTHQLPTLFANPETFDPSRFAPPREEDKKNPYGLIGFGVGAHACIGMEFGKMEMKIFLAKLLREYDWSITPNYSDIVPIRIPHRLEPKFRAVFTPYEHH